MNRSRQRRAELIREAAERVLAGGAGAVLPRLEHPRHSPATGMLWDVTVLRNVLISPPVAGPRQLRGEVVGDAVWKPIITRAQHQQLKALLTDPVRRLGGQPREYLLTGGSVSVACAVCVSPCCNHDPRPPVRPSRALPLLGMWSGFWLFLSMALLRRSRPST